MKKITILLILTSLFSCSRDYNIYYNTKSPNIFKLEGRELISYNLIDSTATKIKYKITGEQITITNNLDNSVDILTKIPIQTIEYENLESNCWEMKVAKKSRSDNSEFSEKQLVKIDSQGELRAYYIKDTDTILGSKYKYKGKMFNKFLVFTKDYESIFIFEYQNDSIKILLNNGYNNSRIYELKKIVALENL